MLSAIIQFLHNYDQTSNMCYERLNIKGKLKQTTMIGGILTLFVDILVVYIGGVKFDTMLKKDANSISSLAQTFDSR